MTATTETTLTTTKASEAPPYPVVVHRNDIHIHSGFPDDDDSTSDDADSIGPLPTLQRSKSLRPIRRSLPLGSFPRPGISDIRGHDQHHDLHHDQHHDQHQGRRHSRGLAHDSSPTKALRPPRPPTTRRRAQSLKHPSSVGLGPRKAVAALSSQSKLPERRLSVNTPSRSLSCRPDPPEQQQQQQLAICPRSNSSKVSFAAGTKSSSGDSGGGSSKRRSIDRKIEDPFPNRPLRRAKSLEAPKQPRRTSSLPLFGRGTRQPQKKLQQQQRNTNVDKFVPRPCKSLARAYPESQMDLNHDVWVQRMVIREGKEPHIFFKSVFSKQCKIEPPTGALNIIYMDEVVKVQEKKKVEDTPKKKKDGFLWGGTHKKGSKQTQAAKNLNGSTSAKTWLGRAKKATGPRPPPPSSSTPTVTGTQPRQGLTSR